MSDVQQKIDLVDERLCEGYSCNMKEREALGDIEDYIKTLEDAIRDHKETLLTADWNSEDERDTILANNDDKLHSVLGEEG